MGRCIAKPDPRFDLLTFLLKPLDDWLGLVQLKDHRDQKAGSNVDRSNTPQTQTKGEYHHASRARTGKQLSGLRAERR